MASKDSEAQLLRERFLEEQSYIQKYVELVQRKAALSPREVSELITLLKKYDFVDVRQQGRWLPRTDQYPTDELQTIHSQIWQVRPEVLRRLHETAELLEQMTVPVDLRDTDARSVAGEAIQYMLDSLEYERSPTAILKARQDLEREYRKYYGEEGQAFIGNRQGSHEELLEFAVQSALYLLQRKEHYEMQQIVDTMEDIDITVRMARGNAEINILRQSFIALMTIFDATVFDLIRMALRRDFFRLIGLFSRQDRLSLDKPGRFSSFEDFRDEVIEEQLKTKYLKDLLLVLDSQNIVMTNLHQGDKFVHIIELVLRRNVHVHNRGIVDAKYLETDNDGTPRYNLYNLTLGTVANIDVSYWERANRLCQNSVTAIANWVTNSY